MKRFFLLFCAGVLTSISFSMPADEVFHGQVMDPQCAVAGTHAQMLGKVGLKGHDPNDPAVKKQCSELCIQMGAKYVLFDDATKRTYLLDNQDKVKQFAGQDVKITGTLDKSGARIHVTNIEPGS